MQAVAQKAFAGQAVVAKASAARSAARTPVVVRAEKAEVRCRRAGGRRAPGRPPAVELAHIAASYPALGWRAWRPPPRHDGREAGPGRR